MKITNLDNGHQFMEISLDQALAMSGVYQDDTDFETDMKLMAWIGRRKHRCIQYDPDRYLADLQQAQQDGIEILIAKTDSASHND